MSKTNDVKEKVDKAIETFYALENTGDKESLRAAYTSAVELVGQLLIDINRIANAIEVLANEAE